MGSNNNGGYLTSKGTLNVTGDSNSSINFGNGTFKVDGKGETTLTSLTFKDPETGVVAATKIKPKWMTFVTDVEGMILKENAPVSVTVPYQKTEIVRVDYEYPVRKIETQTSTGTIMTSAPEGYPPTADVQAGINMTIDSDWTYDGETGGTPNIKYYSRKVSVTNVVKKDEMETGSSWTTKEVTVNGNAEGSTTVKVVSGIKLKITKISMWALTNNAIESSSNIIPVKNKDNAQEYADYNNF